MAGNGQPQGDGTQNPQGEGGEPKYVTEEQLNKAISARFGSFEKKIETRLAPLAEITPEKLSATISESIAAALAATSKPEKGASEGKNGGLTEEAIANSPFAKGMQKQLEEQRKQTEAMKAERDAEKARTRDVTLRTKVGEELTRRGVDPQRNRHALGLLVDAEKRVRWSDDGESIVFKDSDGTDVDLDSGLNSWIKGDDAKVYLPPRGISGSGDQRGKGPNQGSQQRQYARGELGTALAGALSDGFVVGFGPGQGTPPQR